MTNVQTTPEVAQQSPAAPADPTGEQPRTWYFTFGAGQRYDGRYVTIAGTYDEARAEMFRHFGNAWCDHYGSREAAGVDRFGLRMLAHRDWPAATPAGPADLVSAAAAGQPALVRIARANMLRAISRECYAADRPALPTPAGVRFGHRPQEVTLDFDSFTEAAEWAAVLDATKTAKIADTLGSDGGGWLIYTAYASWRGFAVTLAACTPAAAEQTSAVPA